MPSRYVPPQPIPDFPPDIAELVARWNALSAVDFFSVRARLKRIASRLLRRIAHATLVGYADLPSVLPSLAGVRFRLFFCDDDDWFDPDLFALLSGLDLGDADVAVFPFVRFGRPSCTFLDPAVPPPSLIGPWWRFPQRYHTNNYALHPRLCVPTHLAAMQDHFDASAHGDRVGLVDAPVGRIVCATNKTPCAASFLRATVADAAAFPSVLAQHVSELRALRIPPALAWMAAPLAETIALFEQVRAKSR